jgi:3-phenylpropionate/trans-cinnamate dioxygenase ferredoxin reductase subunit
MTQSNDAARYLIVGGGQAGGEVALELRKQGVTGAVTLICEEPHVPYKRPPLSKQYLAGQMKLEQLYAMPQATYDKANVEVVTGVRVTHLDRANKRVQLSDGRGLSYDKLALTTGGRARPLTVAGANHPNVFLVRSIADIEAMRPYFVAGKRLAIIGGGFIGLEVAAVAVKTGLKVTVLESLPRVLARVTAPVVSTFYEEAHRGAGVDLRTSAHVEALEGDARVTHVRLQDGSRVEVDFVVAGIGLIPNTELAQDAGLQVDNGIVVDEYSRTSDPDIVAAGDCANHPNSYAGRRLRLESVQNAMEQGRAAARTMAGKLEPYRMVPWFWSDQYDLKLQMVGLSTGYDEAVVRGNPATRSFAVFYIGDGRIIAADAISKPQDFAFAKKLVAEAVQVDRAKLADESVPLKSLLPAA